MFADGPFEIACSVVEKHKILGSLYDYSDDHKSFGTVEPPRVNIPLTLNDMIVHDDKEIVDHDKQLVDITLEP